MLGNPVKLNIPVYLSNSNNKIKLNSVDFLIIETFSKQSNFSYDFVLTFLGHPVHNNCPFDKLLITYQKFRKIIQKSILTVPYPL